MRLLVDQYVDTVARVRALERELLTRVDLEQALGQASAQALLADTRFFPSGWAGDRHATLWRARRENLDLLVALTFDAPLVDVFRYPADVERLRFALKAYLTGRELPAPVADEDSTLPEGLIRRLAEGEPAEGTPEALLEAVDRARSRWKRWADLAVVDRSLDEGRLAWQRAAARRWRCPFLADYFALVADLANIRSAARARAAGWSSERVGDLLIQGGTIDIEALAEATSETPGALKGLFLGTVYGPLGALAGGPEEMDLEAERVRLRFLRTTRDALEGIEPLVAFYLARERDITTLAIISAGLASGIPVEELRRRPGPIWWEC